MRARSRRCRSSSSSRSLRGSSGTRRSPVGSVRPARGSCAPPVAMGTAAPPRPFLRHLPAPEVTRMARAARVLALARAAERAAGPGPGRARLVLLPPGSGARPGPQGARGEPAEGGGWADGGSAAVEPGWAAPEGGGPGLWRREPGRPADGWREAVTAAAAALQAGGLVAVPTDTVYGVACLAQDSAAVRSIYSLKGRNGAKPLAICLGDVERLYRYCRVNVPDQLLRDLLPGPVTLVLERSEELNKDLNPFTSLVGVRIPDHPFMRDLARACPGPLALTSANISSQGSTLTVLEFQDLWPQLSLVIDGGPIGDIQSPECRLGSTVVDLSVSGKFSIIRPGCALTPTVEILKKKYGLVPESP